MNKFTKLILTTAVFATGVMASESYVSGSLNVDGIINQNENAGVTGAITVNDGGSFNNKATLAFKDGGGLNIAAGSELTANDYSKANTTYRLGVTPIGQYPIRSIIAVCDNTSSLDYISGLSSDEWEIGGFYEMTDDGYNIVARNKVAFESVPTDLPSTGTKNNTNEENCTGNVNWTYDASADSFEIGEIRGKITTDSWINLHYADSNDELGSEKWEYDLSTKADDYVTVKNKVALSKDELTSLPSTINWTAYTPYQSKYDIEWRQTAQTEKDFIAQVKAAIENSAVPKDEKTRLQNGSTSGGTFNNANGTLDFIEATGEEFSGEVKNGTVKLKDTTSATLTSLKVTGVNAEYEYASTDTYTAPTVDSSTQYITVTYTQGKTKDEAESEFVNKFAGESTITKFSGTPYGEANDSRLTFPGILADQNLNKKENKLKTGDIPNVVKDYNKGNGLDVDSDINIQFEGSEALQFATGKADGSDKVIEFAGDNSKYTGSATFASEITKVVANGEKTLPVNLASDMKNITLEINGGNTIKTSGETAVKNLKLNSDATLTVAAGTTLNIGEKSLS